MARVTFSTMYDTTMRYLQRNANNLTKLQEQLSSEKMINRPSDNPIGFANAMNYRNILSSLSQQQINMDDGEIYMTVLETTHQSINNIFARCQELAVQAANDTQNHQNRLFSNMEVRELLEQMVANAQTKHKDNYIFSGKWANLPPYEIKGGQAELRLNSDNSNRNIPINLAYDATDSNSLLFAQGTVTINIFDSEFWDANANPPGNQRAQRIIPGSFRLDGLMEKPNRYTDLAEDDPNYLPIEHPDHYNSDYEVDYVNGTITLISDAAKARFYDPATGDALTRTRIDDAGNAIEILDNMPTVSFEYIYRNSIDMSGEIIREIDSGITVKINTNPDDLFGKKGLDDWDAFKEIISLMQGLWHNEQSEINASIKNLNTGRERNLEQQAIEGARLNRFAFVFERNMDLTEANTDAQSRIEDVNLYEVLTKLSMADTVYNISLQAASRIMQRSLLDYL